MINLKGVQKEFQATGLLFKTPQQAAGQKLIQELLNQKKISYMKLNEPIPEPELQEILLKHQIFSYHPSTNEITFQSRNIEAICKTNFQINISWICFLVFKTLTNYHPLNLCVPPKKGGGRFLLILTLLKIM